LGGCKVATATGCGRAAARTTADAVDPVATHLFKIDDDDKVIAGVNSGHARQPEDTLSDIARRFNLGYAELVRAKPGSGSLGVHAPGARSSCPTQFVLPDAPRDGWG